MFHPGDDGLAERFDLCDAAGYGLPGLFEIQIRVFVNQDVPEFDEPGQRFGQVGLQDLVFPKKHKKIGGATGLSPALVGHDMAGDVQTTLKRVLHVAQNHILDIRVPKKLLTGPGVFVGDTLEGGSNMPKFFQNDFGINHAQVA